MGSFPSVPKITFAKLGWNGTNWSSLIQRTWAPMDVAGTATQNKNSVFMGLNQNWVFTLSSSNGKRNEEDCALTFWDVATLAIPGDGDGTSKKNHDAVFRNCVFPQTMQVGLAIYVNVVIEYMPNSADTYTGFMTYKIDSAYTAF